MKTTLTLGSLFDGIGVFPLVATMCGITPIWASEIEKAPLSITKRHFPNMEHLGDITKINGTQIPPVDIITFGSPCQNLSTIGDRSGLDGAKSSLFYEAIRIIKEMRHATNDMFPTFTLWENVTGALFSDDGLDFRAVLSSRNSKCAYETNKAKVHFFRERRMRQAVADKLPKLFNAAIKEEDICPTLTTKKAVVALIDSNYPEKSHVRRLTPIECERLMGLPNDWTKHGAENNLISDNARIKALGNGVVLPCATFILAGIKKRIG